MLVALLEDLADLTLRNEHIFVIWQHRLVNIAVTVVSGAPTSLLALFSLDWELAVRISLQVVGDVDWDHLGHLLDNGRDIVHTNLAIFVALQ